MCSTNVGFSVGYATNLGFSVGYQRAPGTSGKKKSLVPASASYIRDVDGNKLATTAVVLRGIRRNVGYMLQ